MLNKCLVKEINGGERVWKHQCGEDDRLHMKKLGISLEVQGLRLCAPNAGAPVQSLSRELDLTCHNQELTCCN